MLVEHSSGGTAGVNTMHTTVVFLIVPSNKHAVWAAVEGSSLCVVLKQERHRDCECRVLDL
jgi:hypothetical protein